MAVGDVGGGAGGEGGGVESDRNSYFLHDTSVCDPSRP